MRPQGWESLLSAHIAEARSRVFEWGQHDCVLWCADWLRKLTGTDPAADFRGAYGSEAEALAVLDSLGCRSWSELVDKTLPQTVVSKAKRGDIVLHPHGMLGICDGAHAYFLTERGVTRIEFMKCARAWSVG